MSSGRFLDRAAASMLVPEAPLWHFHDRDRRSTVMYRGGATSAASLVKPCHGLRAARTAGVMARGRVTSAVDLVKPLLIVVTGASAIYGVGTAEGMKRHSEYVCRMIRSSC